MVLKQFFIFLLLVLSISIVSYLYVGTGAIGIDDGNIFLNYAHHLAHGDGFVFNKNGERVEGFTSFLWVLVCSIFYLLTAHPEILLICFSLLLTTLTVTFVFRSIKASIEKIYPQFARYFFWLYCAFIITIGSSFITWSVLSLMENALWNFVFISLVILTSSTVEPGKISILKKICIVIAGCVLMLTRPEALVWNLVFACILLYTFLQNKRKIFYPLAYILCTNSIAIGLTIFRSYYFGFRFPNTYYAKISPDKIYNLTEGVKYGLNFLTGYQPVITFLFVLMTITLLYSIFKLKVITAGNESLPESNVIKKFCIITVVMLIGFVLPCTTGGDHFGGFRFYQDLLLLFAWGILMILWLFKNYNNYKKDIKWIGLSTVIFFFLIIGLNNLIDLKNPAKTQLNFEFLLAQDGRILADKFNKALPEKRPSVGMIAVGGFGLIYEGETVDLMGLNNTLMGHSPGDRKGIKNHAAFNKDVFYQLNPDILLPENINNIKEAEIKYCGLLDVNNFDNQAMKNIFNDADFKKFYSPVFIADRKNSANFFAFVNNNFINSLKRISDLEVQEIH